jgi:hypothetical protein
LLILKNYTVHKPLSSSSKYRDSNHADYLMIPKWPKLPPCLTQLFQQSPDWFSFSVFDKVPILKTNRKTLWVAHSSATDFPFLLDKKSKTSFSPKAYTTFLTSPRVFISSFSLPESHCYF